MIFKLMQSMKASGGEARRSVGSGVFERRARKGGPLVWGMVFLLLAGGGIGEAAVAQFGEAPGKKSLRSVQERGSTAPAESPGVDLPSWAEPRVSGTEASRSEVPTGGVSGGQVRDAQPNAPGGGGPPGDGGGQRVPLGGLEWLLAAGAGYGFWKLREEE